MTFLVLVQKGSLIPKWSQSQCMSILLVQGCSKSKNQPKESVPALDLYSGFFFKIIKKAMREGEFDDQIEICILSAEYGLIDADSEITWYDRRMDTERAMELAPAVQEELQARVNDTYETVVVNVGGAYNRALEGIESKVKSDVYHINGGGIGEKGHVFKKLVRGNLQALKPESTVTNS